MKSFLQKVQSTELTLSQTTYQLIYSIHLSTAIRQQSGAKEQLTVLLDM